MRTALVVLAGSVAALGCGGTRVVYVPAPAPTTVATSAQKPAPKPVVATPRPAPVVMPPVGVNIVRADESRMLVSTNQPAYLVVFAIVPERGATIVYPASARDRAVPLSGSAWLPVSWPASSGFADARYSRGGRDAVDPRRAGRRTRTRYIYAIASERPLRIADAAFDDVKLRDMLGGAGYADDPYETMDALSRRFVPLRVKDEDWGEDMYSMEIARPEMPGHIARVTCQDGSELSVREDLADRDWCASHGGRRYPHADPMTPNDRYGDGRIHATGPAIFRVTKPDVRQAGDTADDDDRSHGDHRGGNGNGSSNGGWNRGNGNGSSGDDANRGNGNGNGNAGHGRAGNGHEDNGNHYGRDGGRDTLKQNGNVHGNPGQSSNDHGNPAANPDVPMRAAPAHTVPEQRPVAGPPMVRRAEPEQRPEQKPEVRQEPEVRLEPKPEPRPNLKSEPEATDRQRGHGQPQDAARQVPPPAATPAPAPAVQSPPAAAAPAPVVPQPREAAPDSTAKPERHRPSLKARMDSTSDDPSHRPAMQ